MGTPLALEGDGLITNLFHFLWSKDDFGEGPQLFIPHTIVYRFTQPSAWFFTSLKTGKIKRKNKVNINNAQIEHEFTKHLRRHGLTTGATGAGGGDIVATYLYQIPAGRERDRGRKNAAAATDNAEPTATTIIEYLDAKGLHDFLMTREKTYDGILQRFVLPKGTSNATIRAIWSPKICLLERRVNRKNLFDKRFSVYERGVTFDGGGAGELFSRPEPVRGAMLPGEVQLLCEKIVDHVTQVSYHKYRISRMVLHLKTDADDRLWLLWCSSLRVLHASAAVSVTDAGLSMSQRLLDSDSVRPLDIVSDAQVPDHVSLGRVPHPSSTATASPGKASTTSASRSKLRIEDRDAPLRDGFQRCTSCAAVVEQHRLLSTTYKAVLEHFQRFLLFLRHRVNDVEHAAIEWPPDDRLVRAAGGVGFGILPFIDRSAASSTAGSLSSPSLSLQSSSTSLRERDLIIPPVIQFLHPLLSVSDFERHRSDPIFQHKPVAVCESCCLVYADFSTSALEPNTLRSNAPAILRPQREVSELKSRVDALDPIATTLPPSQPQQHRALSPTQRPPPSVWKPIPAPTAKPRLQKLAKSSTLQSLPRAPTLPERINSLAEFHDRTSSWSPSTGTSQSNQHAETTSVNAREEAFFRELYHQQGVLDNSDAHPLHHVLESSAKLAQVSAVQKAQLKAVRKGVQSMSSLSSSASYAGLSSTMAAVDQVLEAARDRERKAKNPYAVAQTLPKDPQPRKRRSKPRRSQASRSPGSPSTEAASATPLSSPSPSKRTTAPASPPARRFISSRETRASELHQDFLFAALQDAQRQLEGVESLASIMLLDTAVPVTQQNETETMTKEPMATADELAALLSENAALDAVTPALEEPSTALGTESEQQHQQQLMDDATMDQDSDELLSVPAHAGEDQDEVETAMQY